MPAGVFCALAFLSAGAAILSPHAVTRVRRSGFGGGILLGIAATVLVAAYYGWQVGEYYAKHASRTFPGVSLRSGGEALAGYHSLLALTCLALAVVMLRRRIGRHRAGNAAAGGFGFLAAAFAAGTFVITIPREGNELVMLWIILAPVMLGAVLFLIVMSLVLLVRSARAGEPAEIDARPLCPACRYDLTGNVSGRCPECGGAIPLHLKDRISLPMATVAQPAAEEPTWPVTLARTCDVFAIVVIVLALLKLTPFGLFAFHAIPVAGLRLGLMMTAHPAPIDLAAAVVLMVGAYGVNRRMRWGIAVCLAWGVAHALLAVFDVAQMPEYWQRGRSGGFQWTPLRMQIVLWKLVWGFAFPLFLLFWFRRPRVRRDVRAWGETAGPP